MELALILGVWNKGLKNLSRGLYTFDDKPDYMPWKDTHPVRTNHHLTPCLLFTASEVISEMLPVFLCVGAMRSLLSHQKLKRRLIADLVFFFLFWVFKRIPTHSPTALCKTDTVAYKLSWDFELCYVGWVG
jgi:hypothetical protein